jgi:hypothetical protein
MKSANAWWAGCGAEAIAQRLRAAKTGLTSENGPQGVFLLVGRAASAKPKPRWRWPMCCTAARNH